MSSLRFHRAQRGQSLVKPRKKTHTRKDWDSSVNDLTVHRPTPEELVHRHEIHKSKNQWLAHWEVQKQMLTKSSKKQNRGTPDSWAEKRYDIMRKILQDQYNLTDILEDSDRALAVVKDLFGDAPRRRAGDPNVTLAPSCDLETSCGPIVQRKDPPTRLSVLSQSIMDSQALNETEQSFNHSEESDDEPEVSLNFQPKPHTKRDPRTVRGGDSLNKSQACFGGIRKQNQEEFVTPCRSADPVHDQRALNATTAVKKVKARRPAEELQEQEDSGSMFGRILNNHEDEVQRRHVKGKKKRQVSETPVAEPPSCNTTSLDVLNLMTQDVERELAEYEKQMGREVTRTPRAQGLTGFTFSLVNSVRRLVFSLKESDRLLQQEIQERRCLQRELMEQRMLIDALTAEVFTFKKGIMSDLVPDRLETEGNLTVLPEPVGNLPAIGPPASTQPVRDRNTLDTSGMHATDGVKETAEESPKKCQIHSLSMEQEAREGASYPRLGFQPAVMLSPPRQESRGQFRLQPTLLGKHVPSSPKTTKPSDQKNPSLENRSSVLGEVADRLSGSLDHDRSGRDAGSLESFKVPQTFSHPAGQDTQDEEAATEREDLRPGTPLSDICSRLAQLKQENSTLKSYLQQINGPTGKPAAQATPMDGDISPCASGDTKGPLPGTVQMSLESRIAELNRQSAQAREKLLSLIEQQKQTSILSPEISPIAPQSTAGRRLELSIPMPALNDSSLEETPSPASGRRSASSRSGSLNTSGGAGRRHSAGPWTKVGRETGEGWFALSAHVC